MLKKNLRIKIKDSKGETIKKPRRPTNWRVAVKEYTTPTNINKIGDLKPWRNINIIIAFLEIIVLEIIRIGTHIICETEE